MLNKNSRGSAEEADGSAKMDSNLFLSILVGAVIAIGLGWFVWKNADLVSQIGGAKVILQLCGLAAAVLTLFFGILKLINNMYMASDIEILITLPFSAEQIAVLRVLSFLQLAIAGTLCAVIGPCVGLALAVSIPASDWLAVILGAIFVPVLTVSVAAILVILLMSFLRALRSREVLRYIGMFVLFIVLCVYLFLINGKDSMSVQDMMIQAVGMMDNLKYVVPVIGFAVDFMETGSLLSLLLEILIPAAAVAVFFLVTKALYLKGALNMQDAGGGRLLTEESLDKYCQKKSVMKSLVVKEFLLTRRNPAYLLYNFIVGALWPVLVVLLFKQAIPIITKSAEDEEIQQMLKSITPESFVFFSAIIAIVMLVVVSIPLSMQSLAYSSLSREGKSFFLMKQIPVSYADQLEAKRRMARNVSQISITGYSILILIAAAILLKLSLLYCILPLVLVMLYTEFCVNVDMYLGIRFADVNWDDEKTIARKNTATQLIGIGLMFLIIAIGVAMAFGVMNDILNTPLCLVILLAMGLIFFAGSLYLKKRIMTDGEKKIRRMRF